MMYLTFLPDVEIDGVSPGPYANTACLHPSDAALLPAGFHDLTCPPLARHETPPLSNAGSHVQGLLEKPIHWRVQREGGGGSSERGAPATVRVQQAGQR